MSLKRELGLFDAIFLGLGSIVGTGIFVSIGIATGVAGPSVVLAIVLAALLALCNALSSAQLAAAHPVSGGTYEYGYQFLNSTLGFTAGWMFLWAKSASAATAALGFSGYLLNLTKVGQSSWHLYLALVTILLVTILVWSGVRRTSSVNIALVCITVFALVSFVVACLPVALGRGSEGFVPFFSDSGSKGWYSLLQATALMFVAFTGYGRIATLGEEVVDPQRTIPRAIVATLIFAAILYFAVAAVGVGAVGSQLFSSAAEYQTTTFQGVANTLGFKLTCWMVTIGAMLAMLGVLLNLILGLSRVLLAMGRRRDMPGFTAVLTSKGEPGRAVLVVGTLVAIIATLANVRLTWSFSAFTVLIYYAITNLAAIRMPEEQRLFPVVISWLGLIACIGLTAFVDLEVIKVGLGVMFVGLCTHKVHKPD